MIDFVKTNFDLNDKETVSVIDELPLWSAHFGLKLLDKINYKKNITALDIGSGLGFPLLEIAMRLGTSCKLYGIDPWEAAIERVKSKIKVYEITNIKMITGVAENIPLNDSSVDLIFSNNGLNNVNDLKKVLNECSRISKSGAQLIFTFNTDKTMVEFYSVLENILLEKKMMNEITLMKDHIYKKRRPVKEFVRLLNDNGFNINEICHDQFDYRFTDGSAMLRHFLISLSFLESWKGLVPENRIKEIFGEIENRLNKMSEESGFFKLTIPFVLIDCEKT